MSDVDARIAALPAAQRELFARALAVTDVIVRLVEQAGKPGIPSGHVYAQLMALVSLSAYTSLVAMLVNAGVFREVNHVLFFTGGAK